MRRWYNRWTTAVGFMALAIALPLGVAVYETSSRPSAGPSAGPCAGPCAGSRGAPPRGRLIGARLPSGGGGDDDIVGPCRDAVVRLPDGVRDPVAACPRRDMEGTLVSDDFAGDSAPAGATLRQVLLCRCPMPKERAGVLR